MGDFIKGNHQNLTRIGCLDIVETAVANGSDAIGVTPRAGHNTNLSRYCYFQLNKKFGILVGRYVMVVVDEIVFLHRPKKSANHTPAKC